MSDPHPIAEAPPRTPSLGERVRLPRLSGKSSAAWLLACFVLTAVLIPMALQLPRWVEFEIVLGLWWVVWTGILARMLYAGRRVSDDHEWRGPRNWFGSSEERKPQPKQDPNSAWWDGFFWGSVSEEAVAVVVGLIILVGLIWVLFEIAIPLLVFLLYFVTRGMLARVINDRHRCRGRLGRAVGWAFLWATLYTAPLALAVWFVHQVHRARGSA